MLVLHFRINSVFLPDPFFIVTSNPGNLKEKQQKTNLPKAENNKKITH